MDNSLVSVICFIVIAILEYYLLSFNEWRQ